MLKLYNTRTMRIEDFVPIAPPHVGLYTCGPTVYSYIHLGNLRTYLFEDLLRRVLEFNGYRVKHVMNITDVGHLTDDADSGEDKVERSAREQRRSAHEIAREYEQQFFDDLKKLNVLPPSKVVRATETIELQINLVRRLEARGITYRTSDGIYFNTARFPTYGMLSRQRSDEKRAGARVEINPEKRNPADFALWKFSKPEDQRQMEWNSPWGRGFPGWHLECSAMSLHELGEQFDVHTGGIDHIPTHHENEIAQSEAATGKHPFVKYWLHGAFLILRKRMGKSEGNAIILSEVEHRNIHPIAFRYLTLQSHYRSPLTFTWKSLEAAQRGLLRLWSARDNLVGTPRIGCAEYEQQFAQAINDDLDTPRALTVVGNLMKSTYPPSAQLQSLSLFDRVLGLNLMKRNARTPQGRIDRVTLDRIHRQIQDREAARNKKDWKRSDQLRKTINAELEPYGQALEDTPTGPQIRPRIH